MHSSPASVSASGVAPASTLAPSGTLESAHPFPVLATPSGASPAVALPADRFCIADDPLPPILVADDDEDDRFFIERLVKKTGVQNRIMTFDDGSEVVNFLDRVRIASAGRKHRAPLLLFLDLKMTGLGGFGFLEWARQQKELAPLTIVIMSNSNEAADVSRAMALGAHRYLVKYPCVHTVTTIVRSVYPLKVF